MGKTGLQSERWRSSAIAFQDLTSVEGCPVPKLKPATVDCVFYLYRIDPKSGEKIGPCGSGFIYGLRSKELPGYKHYYGITNWHIANELGASIIRLNTTDGKSRFINFEPEDWHFVPNGDDLAAVDLSNHERAGDQVSHYGDEGSVTPDMMKRFEIGIGEDVFMIGLFVDQHGGDRNTPAARFGNLSLLANEDSLIEQPNEIMRPSFLVDMRSRTGFSGSPVAVYRIPEADLSDLPSGGPLPVRSLTNPYLPKLKFIALLGVHCGSYYDPVEVRTAPPKRKERLGDPIHEGDKLYIQSGMTIVVPAWRITELLDLEVFRMARQKQDANRREAWEKKPRPESVEVAQPPTDANPTHREDFTSLANAAARKQPQGE